MKTYRDNGERWYCDDRSLFLRIRQWFVWFGGWERADNKSWEFGFKTNVAGREKFHFMAPFPLSLFGHRIVFYGWGCDIQLPTGHLVWSRYGHSLQVYISKDGTPQGAHHWIYGTPHDIIEKADVAQQEADRKYEEWEAYTKAEHEKWDAMIAERCAQKGADNDEG